MAGRRAVVLPEPVSEQVSLRPRPPVMLPVWVAAEGVAFAVLLVLGGSAVWQVARVLVALTVTALAVWFTGSAGRTGQGGWRWRSESWARPWVPGWSAGTFRRRVWMLPHGIDGALQRGMEWVQYTAAGLLSGAPRPMSIPAAIRAAAPRPVLIIAGAAKPDEPVAARWFQAASPATVHVWAVPRAGHTQGLAIAPRAWQAHVIGFLNGALHPDPPSTAAIPV